MKKKVVIIGGGAAGIFTAVICAEKNPYLEIVVLEKTRQLLSKVRISGGGRCNVTHSEFDPKKLTTNYPRGCKELLGPFHRFQPQDTLHWFQNHGVELKTEEDGRVFPATDCSATIINCLLDTAKEKGVHVLSERSVRLVEFIKEEHRYRVHLEKQEPILCDYLVLATGGSPQGHELSTSLGHEITDPVPSLFTFNVPSSPFIDLAGITLSSAELVLPDLGYKERGSLLITHFGFSGPAALKLSAFAARDLHQCGYKTPLTINWLPGQKREEILKILQQTKQLKPLKFLNNENLFALPINLWKKLISLAGILGDAPLGHIPDKQLQSLTGLLTAATYPISGKTTHKAEFVTCGGVNLKEIDFKTMQSKILPHLFFAGEILDIDGITGGFNFQNAWTTAYLAASCIAKN